MRSWVTSDASLHMSFEAVSCALNSVHMVQAVTLKVVSTDTKPQMPPGLLLVFKMRD
jgi:hypothetical protein